MAHPRSLGPCFSLNDTAKQDGEPLGHQSLSSLRLGFSSEEKKADKAGHKEAPEQDDVLNVCAASEAAIDGKGGKHTDEYAKLLDSVHGFP